MGKQRPVNPSNATDGTTAGLTEGGWPPPSNARPDFLPSKELVSRLLQHWRDWESPTDRDSAVNETRMAIDCKAAADEISRLTAERDEWKRGSEVVSARLLAEVKRLQAALTDIAEPKGMDNESENALRRHIARRALEGQL